VRRGDVVLVLVPSESGRPRPGVIAQADEFNEELSTIFVCPISSDLQDGLPLRPIIEADPSNGLRLRSQIMTDKLIALRRDRVRRVIGHIDTETSEHLDRALLVVLGLAAVTEMRHRLPPSPLDMRGS
jgi:mRNA interferase MazF